MKVFLVLALALVGCEADPMQPYLGTWSFTSGNNNVSCPTGTTAQKLTGTFTIKPALDAGLLLLDAEGCNLTYDLTGDAATVTNKSCSFPVPELGKDVVAAVTYDAITIATRDGKTLTDTFSGKVTYTSSAGALDCVFSGTASANKVSTQ